MKKRLRWHIKVLTFSLLVSISFPALAGHQPRLQIGDIVRNSDNTFSVPIVFAPRSEEEIASMGFVLHYNAARLRFMRSTPGPAAAGANFNMVAGGDMRRGRIQALVVPKVQLPIPILSPGTVATFQFQVLRGRSQSASRLMRQFRLRSVEFGDNKGFQVK